MTTDGSGNLYASVDGALSEYPPNSTTAQSLLASINIASFAVDSAGDIFAEVPGPDAFQLEEFHAGSNTPSRVIGGSNTQLQSPNEITVTP